jgi:hypothetical protein
MGEWLFIVGYLLKVSLPEVFNNSTREDNKTIIN